MHPKPIQEYVHIKDHKIAWSTNSESSMDLQFLSFHKVQNKHKEVALYIFLYFPTKALCQLRMGILH